ncbi:hypothetical protein N7539_001797 [Penicillium diatomitis]|uniref:T6SS Phospholipase effector Tle1-like catalytic domain-containing protein n=1 Tax=Penicillium diatomitis TaxID=2819901 RepID=A0A9W9XHG0_9EURO|nr:uncharacterized protein N7539_001797 [Penicillium diatomitis]KAJ5493051.1 hypothetical protein N7539_001797 [Penicillium diatomitis]
MATYTGPTHPSGHSKQFVLCFDGTGNKFAGDESDSNVLKIFRMLDRSQSHQYHYYQPGIGTYNTTATLTSHGRIQRIKSWYQKSKDSAVGSSFDQHVMGGYKFLMRYYSPGDEIFFIGFSRGAYIARFLAEMLDYIGLLEAGNEELIRFAWKTFAKWQQRAGDTFRETFSRPIARIRFMGLFDTVNSVPRFENAWMQRSKFPYTARSSARIIRHAVGIDERRAKFRQDLISGQRPPAKGHHKHRHHLDPHRINQHIAARYADVSQHLHGQTQTAPETSAEPAVPAITLNDQAELGPSDEAVPNTSASATSHTAGWGPSAGESWYHAPPSRSSNHGSEANDTDGVGHRYRAPSPRRNSLTVPRAGASLDERQSICSGHSADVSIRIPSLADEEDDETHQDIHEVWFPGCHADIGGGWKLQKGEHWALSHAPLVWMVQEARKAGLELDERKMKQFQCLEEFDGDYSPIREDWKLSEHSNCADGHGEDPDAFRAQPDEKGRSTASRDFWDALHTSSTKGLLHDCLRFNQGLPTLSVLSWRIMEWLPFRRMDLQEDGTWKPISWPLPRGEVRDVPLDAEIHVSAIRRMQADPKYRPGNVIVGGGGRGVRVAPASYGMGEWVVFKNEGDGVRETYVRKSVSKQCKEALEQERKEKGSAGC